MVVSERTMPLALLPPTTVIDRTQRDKSFHRNGDSVLHFYLVWTATSNVYIGAVILSLYKFVIWVALENAGTPRGY